MRQNLTHRPDFFFATAPLPCPYIEGRIERRLVVELMGRQARELYWSLSRAGFRRSHNVAYAPICPDCAACVPVRIPVKDFVLSRNQKRVLRRNQDLRISVLPALARHEHFDLFSAYLNTRHADGDMAQMDYRDYRLMVEDSAVESLMAEFRDGDDALLGVCLVDSMDDGLSAVYSFFGDADPQRSLGTQIILWMVEETRRLGLDYLYLGYWIGETRKMAYKKRFRPLEAFLDGAWKILVEAPSK